MDYDIYNQIVFTHITHIRTPNIFFTWNPICLNCQYLQWALLSLGFALFRFPKTRDDSKMTQNSTSIGTLEKFIAALEKFIQSKKHPRWHSLYIKISNCFSVFVYAKVCFTGSSLTAAGTVASWRATPRATRWRQICGPPWAPLGPAGRRCLHPGPGSGTTCQTNTF